MNEFEFSQACKKQLTTQHGEQRPVPHAHNFLTAICTIEGSRIAL